MKRLFIVFIMIICVSGCAKFGGNTVAGETAVISGQPGTGAGNTVEISGQGNKAADNAAENSKQSNTDIDIHGIIARQESVMKETGSCLADVHMEINLKSGDKGNENISVIAEMKSDIDIDARILSSAISARLSMAGTRNEMEQQIIATGDTIYFRENKASGAQGQWQVKTLDKASSESLWNEQGMQLTGSRYSGLMSAEGFVYTGKEKSNGHTCLVLKQSLDWGRIMETSPELMEQLQGIQGFMPEEIENMVEKAGVSFLIDEQTFHLREFHIDARINREVQGKHVSGDIKQYCIFDAFNQPVSIEVPKDAKPVDGSGQ